jgi:hypothetical protein
LSQGPYHEKLNWGTDKNPRQFVLNAYNHLIDLAQDPAHPLNKDAQAALKRMRNSPSEYAEVKLMEPFPLTPKNVERVVVPKIDRTPDKFNQHWSETDPEYAKALKDMYDKYDFNRTATIKALRQKGLPIVEPDNPLDAF